MLLYNGITRKEIDKMFKDNEVLETDTVFTKHETLVIKDNDKILIPDGCEDKTYIMRLDEDDRYRLKTIIKYSFKFYHDDDFNLKDLPLLKYGKRNYFVNRIPLFDIEQIKDLGTWVIEKVLGEYSEATVERWKEIFEEFNKRDDHGLKEKFVITFGNYEIRARVVISNVG